MGSGSVLYEQMAFDLGTLTFRATLYLKLSGHPVPAMQAYI
jgi:hypothetical protein